MAIFERGRVYWYHFVFNGQHIQMSTKQGNRRVARQMEAAHRTALAKGEAGIFERTPAPILKVFAQRFMDAIQTRSASKPGTVNFYATRLKRLLGYEKIASAMLDRIDEELIERYVQERRQTVSATSVNRELATLRRLLRMAHEWKLIDRVPRIRLLPGERVREFVLSPQTERVYLDAAPQPLHDLSILLLDTGLRVGEAIRLQWRDIRLDLVRGAKFGYLHVREGKSKNAKRNVPLTARVRQMLEARSSTSKSDWLFPGDRADRPILVTSLDHMHSSVRMALRLSMEFVLHSLRHTMLTRLGESGVEAFTIMRIAGHSSVTVSQRYVHPTPEAIERAFVRLEALNQASRDEVSPVPERLLPATVSATVIEDVALSH
jgi:integrase